MSAPSARSEDGATGPIPTPSHANGHPERQSRESERLGAEHDRRRAGRADSRARRDCTHPRAAHVHGTRAAYVKDRCRCGPCTAANTAASAAADRARTLGRWQPFIDATPVRNHIHDLRAAGIGVQRIAALAGIATSHVRQLADPGRDGTPPIRRVRPETAQRALSVRVDDSNRAPHARLGARGTHRRLQALIAIGWTDSQLAAELHRSPGSLRRSMTSQTVTARTAADVNDLYQRLWKPSTADHPLAARRRHHRPRPRGRTGLAAPAGLGQHRHRPRHRPAADSTGTGRRPRPHRDRTCHRRRQHPANRPHRCRAAGGHRPPHPTRPVRAGDRHPAAHHQADRVPPPRGCPATTDVKSGEHPPAVSGRSEACGGSNADRRVRTAAGTGSAPHRRRHRHRTLSRGLSGPPPEAAHSPAAPSAGRYPAPTRASRPTTRRPSIRGGHRIVARRTGSRPPTAPLCSTSTARGRSKRRSSTSRTTGAVAMPTGVTRRTSVRCESRSVE